VFQVQDITRRRQAEEEVRRANRALRTLSNGNQALVRATDEATLLQDLDAEIEHYLAAEEPAE